jgi:N-acetylglucosaminyldiphosphoundecaprenol N-acetyl-beta-D-mannosaminyltransferase
MRSRQAGGGGRSGLPGPPIAPLDLPQAVDRCVRAVEQGSYLSIGMVNAAKVVAMRRDQALRAAVGCCELVLADGQAVVWASALLGRPLPERVAGIDLFTELLTQASRRRYRVYFLGARPGVLRAMLAEVAAAYPGLVIAGASDGYFEPGEEAEVAAAIRRTEPDLLFVGMSSPRKELFLASRGRLTGAKVVHGVGGAFDVLAGVTRRAPLSWQRSGLEWLYRAVQEPVRLGRRYLSTNLAFIALVGRTAIGPRLRGFGGLSEGGR